MSVIEVRKFSECGLWIIVNTVEPDEYYNGDGEMKATMNRRGRLLPLPTCKEVFWEIKLTPIG